MKTGAELIAEERQRQILQEKWTAEHDDKHKIGELIHAAMSYCLEAHAIISKVKLPDCFRPKFWPWGREWYKPNRTDPVRNLVKAGALIAAEIDRLQRLASKGGAS